MALLEAGEPAQQARTLLLGTGHAQRPALQRSMERSGGNGLAEALLPLLDHDDVGLQAAALEVLVFREEAPQSALSRFLTHEESRLRILLQRQGEEPRIEENELGDDYDEDLNLDGPFNGKFKNDVGKLGKALGTSTTREIEVDGVKLDVTSAAYHLIPGNASLKKSTLFKSNKYLWTDGRSSQASPCSGMICLKQHPRSGCRSGHGQLPGPHQSRRCAAGRGLRQPGG